MNRVRMFEQNKGAVGLTTAPVVPVLPRRSAFLSQQQRDDAATNRASSGSFPRAAPPSSPSVVPAFARHQLRKIEPTTSLVESPRANQPSPVAWPTNDEINMPEVDGHNATSAPKQQASLQSTQQSQTQQCTHVQPKMQISEPVAIPEHQEAQLSHTSSSSNPVKSMDENTAPDPDQPNKEVDWPEQKKMDVLIHQTEVLMKTQSTTLHARRARRAPRQKSSVLRTFSGTVNTKGIVLVPASHLVSTDNWPDASEFHEEQEGKTAETPGNTHGGQLSKLSANIVEAQQGEVSLATPTPTREATENEHTTDTPSLTQGLHESLYSTLSSSSSQSILSTDFLCAIAKRALESAQANEEVQVPFLNSMLEVKKEVENEDQDRSGHSPALARNYLLKRSLEDASVIMQDERESSVGSSSASIRSSLSTNELSSIARRALQASHVKEEVTIRRQTSAFRTKVVQQRIRQARSPLLDVSSQNKLAASQMRKVSRQQTLQSQKECSHEGLQKNDSASVVPIAATTTTPRRSRAAIFRAANQRVGSIGALRYITDERSNTSETSSSESNYSQPSQNSSNEQTSICDVQHKSIVDDPTINLAWKKPPSPLKSRTERMNLIPSAVQRARSKSPSAVKIQPMLAVSQRSRSTSPSVTKITPLASMVPPLTCSVSTRCSTSFPVQQSRSISPSLNKVTIPTVRPPIQSTEKIVGAPPAIQARSMSPSPKLLSIPPTRSSSPVTTQIIPVLSVQRSRSISPTSKIVPVPTTVLRSLSSNSAIAQLPHIRYAQRSRSMSPAPVTTIPLTVQQSRSATLSMGQISPVHSATQRSRSPSFPTVRIATKQNVSAHRTSSSSLPTTKVAKMQTVVAQRSESPKVPATESAVNQINKSRELGKTAIAPKIEPESVPASRELEKTSIPPKLEPEDVSAIISDINSIFASFRSAPIVKPSPPNCGNSITIPGSGTSSTKSGRNSRMDSLQRMSSNSVARHRMKRGTPVLKNSPDAQSKEIHEAPTFKSIRRESPRKGRISQHPAYKAKTPIMFVSNEKSRQDVRIGEVIKKDAPRGRSEPTRIVDPTAKVDNFTLTSGSSELISFGTSRRSDEVESGSDYDDDDDDDDEESLLDNDEGAFPTRDETKSNIRKDQKLSKEISPSVFVGLGFPRIRKPDGMRIRASGLLSQQRGSLKNTENSLDVVKEEEYTDDVSIASQSSSYTDDGTSTLPSHLFHIESGKTSSLSRRPNRVSDKTGGFDSYSDDSTGSNDQKSKMSDSGSVLSQAFEDQSTEEPSTLLGQTHVGTHSHEDSISEQATDLESTLIGEYHVKSTSTEEIDIPLNAASLPILGTTPLIKSSDKSTVSATTALQWWQSTYAWTQLEEINAAVQKALTPSSKRSQHDKLKQFEKGSLKPLHLSKEVVERKASKTPLLLKEDDEDIFSGIDEAADDTSKLFSGIDEGTQQGSKLFSGIDDGTHHGSKLFSGIDEGIQQGSKLFSSIDEGTLQGSRSSQRMLRQKGDQKALALISSAGSSNSFEDDIFSGVTNSMDSSNILNKQEYGTQYFATRLTTEPPPPPSSRFGTVLDSSTMLETVNSDITSSLIAGEGPSTRDMIDPFKGFEGATTNFKESSTYREDNVEVIQKGLIKALNPTNQMGSHSRHKQKSLIVASSDDGTLSSKHTDLHVVSRNKMSTTTIDENKENDVSQNRKFCTAGESKGTPFFRFGQTLIDTFAVNLCVAPGSIADPNDTDDLRMSEAKSLTGLDQSTADRSVISDNASVADSEMTENEKKVWDAWDRRDSCSVTSHFTNSLSGVTSVTPKSDAASPAAGKLKGLLGPRVAISAKPLVRGLSGLGSPTTSEGSSTTGSDSLIEYPTEQSDPNTSSDLSSKMMIFEDSSEDTSRRSGAFTPQSRGTTATGSSAASSSIPETASRSSRSSTFSINQRRILERFSSSLRRQGIEVLKLSRDNKWQLRHLTVSSETKLLNFGASHSGDKCPCPLGILWQKRFNPQGKDASVTCIDSVGHGGMIVDDLRSVAAWMKSDPEHPIPRKFLSHFSDSVAVSMTYTLGNKIRAVVLRCKTMDEAHFVCTGLRVLVDILRRENAEKMKALIHSQSGDDNDDGDYDADYSADSTS